MTNYTAEQLEKLKKAGEIWDSLPYSTREELTLLDVRLRIQRLKEIYNRNLREINDHINNLLDYLDRHPDNL